MKWLPYHRFEMVSPLKTDAALAAMAAKTEPEKLFRWRWPNAANDQRFQGVIEGDRFRVRRILGYNNSFLPVIEGVVQAEARGSRILITMRPFVFVFVFLGLWLVVMAASLYAQLWAVGPVMLLFVYVMTMGGFWFEAGKQERTLREIFQAR